MAKKRATGKTKSNDGGYIAPPGSTNANRVIGTYKDEGMSIKQYFDSLYKQTPSPSRGPVKDLMGNPLRPSSKPMQGSAQMRNQNPPVIYPKAPDKLSGRTAEFGTRSMLEGMKSWMRGGGGFRIGGK